MEDRPDTLTCAVPPQPQGILVAQAKTWHFWIFVITSIGSVVLRSQLVGARPWALLAGDLLPIVQFAAYQVAALWEPPRADWTDEQRNSHYASQLRAAGYTVERERRHDP